MRHVPSRADNFSIANFVVISAIPIIWIVTLHHLAQRETTECALVGKRRNLLLAMTGLRADLDGEEDGVRSPPVV